MYVPARRSAANCFWCIKKIQVIKTGCTMAGFKTAHYREDRILDFQR